MMRRARGKGTRGGDLLHSGGSQLATGSACTRWEGGGACTRCEGRGGGACTRWEGRGGVPAQDGRGGGGACTRWEGRGGVPAQDGRGGAGAGAGAGAVLQEEVQGLVLYCRALLLQMVLADDRYLVRQKEETEGGLPPGRWITASYW